MSETIRDHYRFWSCCRWWRAAVALGPPATTGSHYTPFRVARPDEAYFVRTENPRRILPGGRTQLVLHTRCHEVQRPAVERVSGRGSVLPRWLSGNHPLRRTPGVSCGDPFIWKRPVIRRLARGKREDGGLPATDHDPASFDGRRRRPHQNATCANRWQGRRHRQTAGLLLLLSLKGLRGSS